MQDLLCGVLQRIDEKPLESLIQGTPWSDLHLRMIILVWRMCWEGVRLRAEK